MALPGADRSLLVIPQAPLCKDLVQCSILFELSNGRINLFFQDRSVWIIFPEGDDIITDFKRLADGPQFGVTRATSPGTLYVIRDDGQVNQHSVNSAQRQVIKG